jgi:hypothetical protein
MHHSTSSPNLFAKVQTTQGTDLRSADSSANEFGDAYARQRTDSLLHTTSSGKWFAEAQTRQRTDLMHHKTSLANWFAEAPTRQGTGSLKHGLVSEMMR